MAERKGMIEPGASVRANVERFQLRRIIERAEAGGYGPRSGDVLMRSRAHLAELEGR